jgi:hypothetical protein
MAEVPAHDGRPFWEMKVGIPIDQHFIDMVAIEDSLSEKLGFDETIKVRRRILDRHFGRQQRGGQVNLFDKYRELSKEYNLKGRWVDSYSSKENKSEIKYGHSIVRNNLSAYLPDGHPKTIFWSSVPHTIQAMQTYSYKVKLAEGASFGDNILDKGKDGADVVRYVHCDKLINYKPTESNRNYKVRRKTDWIKKIK